MHGSPFTKLLSPVTSQRCLYVKLAHAACNMSHTFRPLTDFTLHGRWRPTKAPLCAALLCRGLGNTEGPIIQRIPF